MLVEVRGIGKSYGQRVALSSLAFDLAAGDMMALLGPNGCGKTTAMGIVAGLVRGEGTVRFDGKPLNGFPNPASILGVELVPRVFHPGRTAESHLRMIAAGAGVPFTRVDDMLHEVGLNAVRGNTPRSFSLGMRQRLSLASALIARPSVLILDEPLNGLDLLSISWLLGYLRNFTDRGGSVLISSHVFEPIEHLVDRVVVMAQGHRLAEGSVAELRELHGSAAVRIACDPADLDRLETCLRRHGLRWESETSGVLNVKSDDPREVAYLASAESIVLTQITPTSASLSDLVLNIVGRQKEIV